jgi:malic enzyme
MQASSQILERMQREKQMLLQAEQITEEMQTAPGEELAALTARRGRFIEEASRLHEEERRLCAGDPLLLAAWSNAADPEKLSPGSRQIYDASLAVKAVANRIRRNSEPARRHLEQEQKILKDKLDELNSSPAKAIEKYVHVLRGGTPGSYPGRDTKI